MAAYGMRCPIPVLRHRSQMPVLILPAMQTMEAPLPQRFFLCLKEK